MNPIRSIVNGVYALFGYSTIELELTDDLKEQLEERARRIGLSPSQYLQAIAVKHLLDHEDEVAEAVAKQVGGA